MGKSWCYSTIAIVRGKWFSTSNTYVQNFGISLYNIKKINQFEIGYMINPSLRVNTVFREKVEKWFRATFHENKMENIRYVMRKKDTCVIAIIMFYGSK